MLVEGANDELKRGAAEILVLSRIKDMTQTPPQDFQEFLVIIADGVEYVLLDQLCDLMNKTEDDRNVIHEALHEVTEYAVQGRDLIDFVTASAGEEIISGRPLWGGLLGCALERLGLATCDVERQREREEGWRLIASETRLPVIEETGETSAAQDTSGTMVVDVSTMHTSTTEDLVYMDMCEGFFLGEQQLAERRDDAEHRDDAEEEDEEEYEGSDMEEMDSGPRVCDCGRPFMSLRTLNSHRARACPAVADEGAQRQENDAAHDPGPSNIGATNLTGDESEDAGAEDDANGAAGDNAESAAQPVEPFDSSRRLAALIFSARGGVSMSHTDVDALLSLLKDPRFSATDIAYRNSRECFAWAGSLAEAARWKELDLRSNDWPREAHAVLWHCDWRTAFLSIMHVALQKCETVHSLEVSPPSEDNSDYLERCTLANMKFGVCPTCTVSKTDLDVVADFTNSKRSQTLKTQLAAVVFTADDDDVRRAAEGRMAELDMHRHVEQNGLWGFYRGPSGDDPQLDYHLALQPDHMHTIEHGIFLHMIDAFRAAAFEKLPNTPQTEILKELDARLQCVCERCTRTYPQLVLPVATGNDFFSREGRFETKQNRSVMTVCVFLIFNIIPRSTGKGITACFVKLMQMYVRLFQRTAHTRASLDECDSLMTDFVTTIKAKLGRYQPSNWKLPKLHDLMHMRTSIERSGVADTFAADVWEHHHRRFCKQPYMSSNKRKASTQMVNHVRRSLALQEETGFVRKKRKRAVENRSSVTDCMATGMNTLALRDTSILQLR
ncbi:hypothetical protein CBR_g3527 [Chara braunii]|uniref:Uncharacterized protein n=1 Tax=Chara braunii TaxID=69332 RepID=A0A388KFT5_CHABU|nr:hypothetical protein CBR_g3527 [Chara braunii]|eukprot:GBG68833.1 hypothetical protein CBR_g3527 [Chara braunii]